MTSDFVILLLVSVGSLAGIYGLASLEQTRSPSPWRTMALTGMVVVFLAATVLAGAVYVMLDDGWLQYEDNDQARGGFEQVAFS
jgi:hypothetical protein